MKKLSIKSHKKLFGFLAVLMFLITVLGYFFPEIQTFKIIGIFSAVLCVIFLLFWAIALDINNPQKEDLRLVSTAENSTEDDEAMLTIFELQTLIKKETGHRIKFVFEIDDAGMMNISVPRGFTFELRNKDKNPVTKKFQGRDFVEVVNTFVDYFKEGGQGRIAADEDNFQLRAQFHYEEGWIINNSYVGYYAHTDSLDE